MTMAMIVVVIVAKAGILLHALITDGSTTTPLLAPAHAAAADHFQEPPKPVPAAPKPATAAATPAGNGTQRKARTGTQGRRRTHERKREGAACSNCAKDAAELDARANAINEREAVLGAAEQKLDAKVGELKSLQRKLETLDTAQKQKEDTGWQSMVKLYEAMKPREAAAIFNDLSMQVLLQVMDRMKDAKAAAVLAAMTPDKARDVTAALAQMRTGRDAAAAEGAKSAGS